MKTQRLQNLITHSKTGVPEQYRDLDETERGKFRKWFERNGHKHLEDEERQKWEMVFTELENVEVKAQSTPRPSTAAQPAQVDLDALAELVVKRWDLDALAERVAERLKAEGYLVSQQPAELRQRNHELDGMRQYLQPEDVQNVLRISRATFFRLVSEGQIPGAVRIGKGWRVDRDRLREYMWGK